MINWRKMSGALCNKRIELHAKGKINEMAASYDVRDGGETDCK